MTPLTAWVPASELRVGDRARLDGMEVDLTSIRSYRGYLFVTTNRGVSHLLAPAQQVEVVLEDDGR